MKTVILSFVIAIFLSLCIAGMAPADPDHVQFKIVLLPGEEAVHNFDAVEIAGDTLYVWKFPYLADRDIERVDMLQSVSVRGRIFAAFNFNEHGKNRLYRLAKMYGSRRVVISADENILATTLILPPAFLGERVIVAWPGTESELRKLLLNVNKRQPGIITLYIEEQGRYNDVAADSWAEAYGNIVKYFESRSDQFSAAKDLVEEAREE